MELSALIHRESRGQYRIANMSDSEQLHYYCGKEGALESKEEGVQRRERDKKEEKGAFSYKEEEEEEGGEKQEEEEEEGEKQEEDVFGDFSDDGNCGDDAEGEQHPQHNASYQVLTRRQLPRKMFELIEEANAVLQVYTCTVGLHKEWSHFISSSPLCCVATSVRRQTTTCGLPVGHNVSV